MTLSQILAAASTSRQQHQIQWDLNHRIQRLVLISAAIRHYMAALRLYKPRFVFRARYPSACRKPGTFYTKKISKRYTRFVADNCSPKHLELGIVLLELWYAKSFAAYANEVGLSLSDSFSHRYDTAVRWVEFSVYDILPCYLDVVRRCIECTFATNHPVPDWNDSVFRKSICQFVLKPCGRTVQQTFDLDVCALPVVGE
ncbi:hypothetical protein BDV10DRAFT_65393 [Aspergillus recurvatus]